MIIIVCNNDNYIPKACHIVAELTVRVAPTPRRKGEMEGRLVDKQITIRISHEQLLVDLVVRESVEKIRSCIHF